MPRWLSVFQANFFLHKLGHVVNQEGIKVDPRKIKIVIRWHRPLELGNDNYSWGFAITFTYSSMNILR